MMLGSPRNSAKRGDPDPTTVDELTGMTEPFHADNLVTLHHGDCLDRLRDMPDNSVDAIVTDPPYGLSNTTPDKVADTIVRWASGDREHVPEGRGFMGRPWDAFVPPPAVWDECLRVLKPGGHMAVFAGSRTQDLMGMSIRLAGFEIRDSLGWGHSMLAWCYGSGFPKSHNVNKDKRFCQCLPDMRDPSTEEAAKSAAEILLADLRRGGKEDTANIEDLHGVPVHIHPAGSVSGGEEQDVLAGVRSESDIRLKNRHPVPVQHEGDSAVRNVRHGCDSAASVEEAKREDLLLSQVQRTVEGRRACECGQARSCGVDGGVRSVCEDQDVGGEQPCLEGRCHVQAPEGELCGASVCAVPCRSDVDGTKRRLHHGAPPSDGAADRSDVTSVGGGESHQPRPEGQSGGEPGTVPVERGSQAWGGWPVCGGCGKPALPAGIGTALKPAWEPIILARRPLDGTVAANVLAHGVGGLNIDACRVGTEGGGTHCGNRDRGGKCLGHGDTGKSQENPTFHADESAEPVGRFPANVLLDEHAAKEMDKQSGVLKSGGTPPRRGADKGRAVFGEFKGQGDVDQPVPANTGGASRFFPVFKYQAKAPKKERPVIEREDGTKVQHPTVKPEKLMEWLVTLITPPGGVVLDPFAGSGTTLEAARDKGFRAVGVEADAEHCELIVTRLEKGDDGLFAA